MRAYTCTTKLVAHTAKRCGLAIDTVQHLYNEATTIRGFTAAAHRAGAIEHLLTQPQVNKRNLSGVAS